MIDTFNPRFSQIRSHTYTTIVFEVVFNSRGDLVTLFLETPAEAEATTWRDCRAFWRLFLRYSCKSYHVSGMLGASAAQMCQRASII